MSTDTSCNTTDYSSDHGPDVYSRLPYKTIRTYHSLKNKEANSKISI